MQQILNGNKPPTIKMVGGKGISIIEILVIVVIIGTALVGLLGLATFSLKVSTSIKESILANFSATETIEAVRNFRDEIVWNNNDPENKYDGLGIITAGAAYHAKKSSDPSPRWMLLQGEETIGSFTRKVIFEKVSRNPATDNIENIYNPANDDPGTRKAIATVSWKNKKVEMITYFTNWQQ